MGSRDLTDNVTRSLLAYAKTKGYPIVPIDYRLASEMKPPAIISDIEEAFRWLGGHGV
jgi:acetyl esterase/lipase